MEVLEASVGSTTQVALLSKAQRPFPPEVAPHGPGDDCRTHPPSRRAGAIR